MVTVAATRQPPTAIPTAPHIRFSNGAPVEIDGELVYHGSEIEARKAETGSFLVIGTLNSGIYDCMIGHCPASTVWFLSDPSGQTSLQLPLLTAGQAWAPDDAPRWPGGLVVLRVRAYDATCPWDGYCATGLLVEAAIGE
jgi:hypothetical protein